MRRWCTAAVAAWLLLMGRDPLLKLCTILFRFRVLLVWPGSVEHGCLEDW
jgi:hypothetical protein